MFETLGLGLGLCLGLGLGLGSALRLLLWLILLGTLSLYYCAHSIDRQRAIIKVPACSRLLQKHLWHTSCSSGIVRPLAKSLPLVCYRHSRRRSCVIPVTSSARRDLETNTSFWLCWSELRQQTRDSYVNYYTLWLRCATKTTPNTTKNIQWLKIGMTLLPSLASFGSQ